MIKTFKKYFQLLKKPILNGKRLDRHLDISAMIGIIIASVCTVTTVMNIIQQRGIVIYTTIAIVIAGLFIAYSAKVMRNLKLSVWTAITVCMIIMTYYTIDGTNEGFAVLWTLLMPLAVSYFCGVIYGIAVSMYFEILFVILFYTPMRPFFADKYQPVFMDRYPVLYLSALLLTSVAMINYHVSVLKQEEYEKKLKEAAAAAVAAERAKSRFLAQMSHEIRTPINAVLGMNEMILRSSDDPETLEYADSIQSSGKTLLSLINSILDFSKIEDGKMELIPADYDTASLINNIVNSISARAAEKGLELITDIDGTLPSQLNGDDVRISQIIMNLLTNAVKYTDKGSVTLSVRNLGITDGTVTVGVSVKDTGTGIKKEDMGRLFESFERLDELKNRNIEGSGLGMSIVTGLLAMMNSGLKVESEYGKGSVFSFEIKQDIVDGEPMGDYGERLSRAGHRSGSDITVYAPDAAVLVVDDNEMNLKVAKNLLKLFGITADLAPSGARAVEMMRARTYDMVLLDHMMPGMDGVETLGKLEEQDLIPDKTTIVALTANAIAGAREKYISKGFDDYLSKPVEIPKLEKALKRYLPAELLEQRKTEPAGKHSSAADPVTDESGEFEIMEFLPEDDGGSSDTPGPEDSGLPLLDRLTEKGISAGEGLRYCADDEDFYKEMLTDYARSSKEKAENLERLYESGDMKEYSVLVHALKSTSKTIGANDVSEKAKALEAASKNGDTETVRLGHGELMRMYAETAKNIESALNLRTS